MGIFKALNCSILFLLQKKAHPVFPLMSSIALMVSEYFNFNLSKSQRPLMPLFKLLRSSWKIYNVYIVGNIRIINKFP